MSGGCCVPSIPSGPLGPISPIFPLGPINPFGPFSPTFTQTQSSTITGVISFNGRVGIVVLNSTDVVTALATNALAYTKLQQETASTLLGNPTGVTGNIQEITLGSGLSFSGTTLVATGSLSGSGTTNFIPLWTGSTALGNSYLSQSGNNIVITSGKTFSGVTSTTFGYLDATSSIQTQLNNIVSGGVWTGLANTYLLTIVGGVPVWTAPPVTSPLTTKGDIYTYSTTQARLPIGADATILMADATQTTGNKWIAPSGDFTLALTGVATAATTIVKSVVLNTPNVIFATPVTFTTATNTATGTLALNTQTANYGFFGPTTGSAATPTFRALVAADIPAISLTTGISGILPSANGGTGVNNGSTITIGGAIIFSGAYGFTATLTNTTSVTFPTAGTLATLAGTETFTNKRITFRTVATTQSATPTINTDNGDIFDITALASNITSFTTNLTGTPVNKDMMMIHVTDNGTARTLAFGTSFAPTTNIPLPTTTVISTLLRMLFEWNSATSKWELIALN